MSPSVRSLFRSHRSSNRLSNVHQQQNSRETLFHDRLHTIDYQQAAVNLSCCGGDEKKTAAKNQAQAPRMVKEATGHTKALADPMDASDHKIVHVTQQQAANVNIDEGLKDLFGKKEISKAMINQLARRALAGPMNSRNDDPPRLCTKKHCSFANEPLTIKPMTCVPGIGTKHGNLCEKQGIVMAHQLLSRYMMSANDDEFEKSLVGQLGFTARAAAMARDGLKEMRRHLI